MNPEVRELFDMHVASTYDKQLFLADLVGNNGWRFDMFPGVISFGPKLAWKAQVLGSEARATNTWLWSWANTASNIPGARLKAAGEMRKLGAERSLRELTQPQFPLAEVDGAVLSVIAAGVCQARASYRGPYPGGAAFFLIDDPEYPRFIVDPAVRISIVFPQVISAYEVNHRRAFAGYLAYYGLESQTDGAAVVAGDSSGPQIRAEFDAMDRLVKIISLPRSAGEKT
jgi:hypothetical protein